MPELIRLQKPAGSRGREIKKRHTAIRPQSAEPVAVKIASREINPIPDGIKGDRFHEPGLRAALPSGSYDPAVGKKIERSAVVRFHGIDPTVGADLHGNAW